MKKIQINKKHILIIVSGILFLAFVIYVLLINISSRKLERYTEITFVSPNQAVIFWKTNNETLGYVKYGEKRLKIRETVLQTSSEESKIHVVFIENIPSEGIYIKKLYEGKNIFLFPVVEKIKYDEINEIDE